MKKFLLALFLMLFSYIAFSEEIAISNGKIICTNLQYVEFAVSYDPDSSAFFWYFKDEKSTKFYCIVINKEQRKALTATIDKYFKWDEVAVKNNVNKGYRKSMDSVECLGGIKYHVNDGWTRTENINFISTFARYPSDENWISALTFTTTPFSVKGQPDLDFVEFVLNANDCKQLKIWLSDEYLNSLGSITAKNDKEDELFQ